MDISEEFEARRLALQLMRRRTQGELKRLQRKVLETAHRSDEAMEAALQRAQEQMTALVTAANHADNQQNLEVEQLGEQVQKALLEGQDLLRQLEEVKASRAREMQLLNAAIELESLDVEDQFMQAKRDIRTAFEQLAADAKSQIRDKMLRLEGLSKSVRDNFRELLH
jgi:hypothetical protein